MSFEEYVRGPRGRLRSYNTAPYVPTLKYPRHMDRIIGDFALEVANMLVDKADTNACGTLLYNYSQENDFDNDLFIDMVRFAVDVAVMNAADERITDLTRNMRRIVDNTGAIWRSKMAIKFQSQLDDRELSDRELRAAKDALVRYEDICESLETFMRSRAFEDQLDDIERRGDRGRGRDDDRYSRGRGRDDDRGRGRDREERGRDRDDRSVRGFGRERGTSDINRDGGARDDRFANVKSRRDDRDDRRGDERGDQRDGQGNKPAQTGQNNQIPQPKAHIFPNVPTLELDENMKREDHELLPSGSVNLREAEARGTEDVLYKLFKESSQLGVGNEHFQIHPGYIVDTDLASLQKTAQSQFVRAILADPKINTHITYGCALNPMLGLTLELDGEKVATLKQFRAVYTEALAGVTDQRVAASALRQLDHMLTQYVNEFLVNELNIAGLDIDSYFNDGIELSLHLHQHYGKAQLSQYRDFEERLLTFLTMQDDNLFEVAKDRVKTVLVADSDASADVDDVPFFIAPLMYSFMHLNVYKEELGLNMKKGVHVVDSKRTPLVYARLASTSVNKMRSGMRTLVDLMVDLDGNVYRWFESATEKGTYYIIAQ